MAIGKKVPQRVVRGIRDTLPAGHIVGRISRGDGPAELIHVKSLGTALTAAANGGSGGGGGVASVSSVDDAQRSADSAATVASVAYTRATQALATSGMVAAIDLAPGGDLPIPMMPQSSDGGTAATALSDLTDVTITSPADGDILEYNSTDSKWENVGLPVYVPFKCGDNVTAITTGTGKDTFRVPCPMTLDEVRVSLATAQVSGSLLTFDVKQNTSTIFSTLLTIDNGEKTSTSAATPAVLSTTSLSDDDEIRIDVTQVGSGEAAGAHGWLIGRKAAAAPAPPFDPTTISGLELWLDFTDDGNVTVDGSGNISQVSDKSGNSRHATQSTAGPRPGRTLHGSGKAGDWTGSEFLQTTSFSVSQPFTIVLAGKATTTTSYFHDSPSGTRIAQLLANGSGLGAGGDYLFGWAGSGSGNGDTATTDRSVDLVSCFIGNGASSQMLINGVQRGTTGLGSGTGGLSSGLYIGSNQAGTLKLSGYIWHVLIYNSALGSTDRTNLFNYLKTSTGISF